jgi:O-antigen ligase
MMLVTGSRAGLLLGGAAAAWAAFQHIKDRRVQRGQRGTGWKLPVTALSVLLAVGGVFTYVSFSRAQALQRVLNEADFELRLQVFPVLLRMARDMFPFGSGFGTFDPVYRIYEPYGMLSPRYLNQAHNDLLELAITGGLPALLLLLIFMAWWAFASVRAFRAWNRPSRTSAFARLGSAMVLLLCAWSLVDYPLRVPILAAVLAIACGWLGGVRRVPPAVDRAAGG